MSDVNKSVTTPMWINIAFIQKALHNAGEENVQVESITSEIGTAPGDNYSSEIYRVYALLNDGRQRSLLIKTIQEGGEMEIWARTTKCFERESAMLVEIMPRIQALLDEAAPGQWSHLAPSCPLHGDSPNFFIVMEDLRPQGFGMAERMRGMGLRHCLTTIRALACYHAAGHLLTKSDMDLTRLDNVYNHHPDYVSNYIEGGIKAAADVCRSWPGFEECAVRLEKFKPIARETLKFLNDPKPDAFNVIIHGDLWTNNIMFRYDEDRHPIEIRLVDFQSSRVASPAIDILNFLTTSLSDDVSTHHQDLLIREYYFALQEAMTLLGLKAPSFETILADIDAHGPHSILGTTTTAMSKATQPLDLERVLLGDLTPLTELYNTPEVKKYMQRALPELKRKGWLPV